MLQDTVLVGGFAFLLSGSVIWFLLNKVNASTWSPMRKRVANYALLATLIGVAIFVIDWHSSNYKSNYDVSHIMMSPMMMERDVS